MKPLLSNNMKRKNSLIRLLPVAAVMLLYSCDSTHSPDSAIVESSVTTGFLDEVSIKNAQKVQEIFYSVPSPMEMASILKKSGATYDISLLNDVKRVSEYTTASSRALNLGIYGADLSYASIFNQNQEAIIYLSCSKKLADNLGVTKAFDDSTIERMEANVENRDSLLNIISETYYMLDAYLKENGRDHISAMVIAAGWVEGLYLATTIASKDVNPDPLLLRRIAEQKLSLNNLEDLVKAYNKGNQLNEILDDLKRIRTAYDKVQMKKEKSTVGVSADGSTVIGGATQTEMSKETLEEITKVVNEIRTRYVS